MTLQNPQHVHDHSLLVCPQCDVRIFIYALIKHLICFALDILELIK